MDLTAADLRSGGDVGTSGRAQAAEGPRRPAASLRKCASTPALRLLGAPAGAEAEEGAGLEVFVVLRNFQETLGGVLHRLPPRVRDCVRDAGVCHYMIAVRKPDGSIVQFDFGPKAGGDIHVGAGPLAAVLSKAPRARGRASRRVDGTVRECQVRPAPATAPRRAPAAAPALTSFAPPATDCSCPRCPRPTCTWGAPL
jgi:hypothetical protein